MLTMDQDSTTPSVPVRNYPSGAAAHDASKRSSFDGEIIGETGMVTPHADRPEGWFRRKIERMKSSARVTPKIG